LVYETAASMNGAERSLRLAIKNQGEQACSLSGIPAISLEDGSGAEIASVAVRQTGTTSLSGVVVPPVHEVASDPAREGQLLNVVLPGSGEASFEIGWSSGDSCPLVSRIAIGFAGMATASEPRPARFSIDHAMRVCDGEVRITSLLPGSSI
jgi:hypothetical protein